MRRWVGGLCGWDGTDVFNEHHDIMHTRTLVPQSGRIALQRRLVANGGADRTRSRSELMEKKEAIP